MKRIRRISKTSAKIRLIRQIRGLFPLIVEEKLSMTMLSFMTANYVARETGYHVTEGWMQGDDAVNAYFAPLDTYAERFAALLAEIQGLGFTCLLYTSPSPRDRTRSRMPSSA